MLTTISLPIVNDHKRYMIARQTLKRHENSSMNNESVGRYGTAEEQPERQADRSEQVTEVSSAS